MQRVPYDALQPDTLRRLIESFVLREGTDYGSVEYDLDAKVEHVMKQLRSGKATVVFDDKTQSASIMLERDLPPEERDFEPDEPEY